MKLSKKKVFALALAVCLIATLSFGSLAWFTDNDSVKNDFMIAGSDGDSSDDIFSVEVSEESTDPDATKTENGIQYDKVLPGDKLSKIVTVTNTGAYNQYIRVKVEVSNAALWQEIYQAHLIPVDYFIDLDLEREDLYGVGTYLEGDKLAYYLYFTEELEPGKNMNVFNNAFVASGLTQQQAFEIDGKFTIKVTADAVQTENVGDDVYAAFTTVGMVDETNAVNTAWVEDKADLKAAFGTAEFIVLNKDITNMYAADKLNADNAELFMNGCTLETAYGEWQGQYGIVVKETLTISGEGTFSVGSLKAQVGELVVKGAEVVNPTRIVIA